MEPARCPHPDCLCVFPVEDPPRDGPCPGCARPIRPRLVRHEPVLEDRRLQAARRVPALGAGSVCLLLDGVRSLWNVGSILRSADGLGAAHVFLCGITGIPPHPRLHETALGAEEAVSWSYHPHPFEAIEGLRREGVALVALELTDLAVPLEASRSRLPICLVLGNEPGGVSPEVLAACDEHLVLPMRGVKESLNVAVVAGIALHWFTREGGDPDRSAPGRAVGSAPQARGGLGLDAPQLLAASPGQAGDLRQGAASAVLGEPVAQLQDGPGLGVQGGEESADLLFDLRGGSQGSLS